MRGIAGLALLMAVSTPARASVWHVVSAEPAIPLDAEANSVAFLNESGRALGLTGIELRVIGSVRVSGGTVVHLGQMHSGAPVLERGVTVRVDHAGVVNLVVTQIERLVGVEMTPGLSAAEALRVVGGSSAPRRVPAWLAVMPQGAGGRLVYVVDQPSSRGGQRVLVDASTGALVQARSLARHAQGRVYGISSAVSIFTQDVELFDLTVSTPLRLNGWDGNLQVVNYVSGSEPAGTLVVEQAVGPNFGEDFLYDPPASGTDTADAFAQVGLYYHLTRGRAYFQTVFSLAMTGTPWSLVAVANYQDAGVPFDDGFYSSAGLGAPWNASNLIALGQGQTFDWANDSDPILHEVTHYVSQNAFGFDLGPLATTSYGLSPFSAAIGEGLADYFACTINGDPTFGEASLVQLGAGRDLTDTSKVCPGDLSGDVVLDGAIVSTFSWSLRSTFDAAIADQLVFEAAALLPPGASLGDFARGIQQAGIALVSGGTLFPPDLVTIDAMLATRGLDGCDAELEFLPSNPQSTFLRGLDEIAVDLDTTCEDLQLNGDALQSLFHYRAPTRADQIGIRFTVDLALEPGTIADWDVFVRGGQPVGFELTGQLPTVTGFDYAVESLTDTSSGLVIDGSSSPPFIPGQDYYLVLTHRSCGGSTATVLQTELALFADGFETGDTTRWTATTGGGGP